MRELEAKAKKWIKQIKDAKKAARELGILEEIEKSMKD